MNKNINLEQILKELREELDQKKDFIFDSSHIRVNDQGRLHFGDEQSYELNQWSTYQFCNKIIGVPQLYYNRCTPELQKINANYWLEQLKEGENERFIRLNEHRGLVRGMVSDKYSPFDDHELFDILHQMIGNREDYEIDMWHRDDSGFHLRLVFDSLTTEIGKTIDGESDIHKVGIHIQNSEVGKSSLVIKPLVFRQICSNGLMGWASNGEVFRQRHIHVKREDMYERVAQAVSNALEAGDQAIETLEKSKEITVDDPMKTIDELAKKYKYTKKRTESIKESFEQEPKGNVFYLVQAFTHASHEEKNHDARVEMEQHAGEILRSYVAA